MKMVINKIKSIILLYFIKKYKDKITILLASGMHSFNWASFIYLSSCDWFGTKPNSVLFRIDRRVVNCNLILVWLGGQRKMKILKLLPENFISESCWIAESSIELLNITVGSEKVSLCVVVSFLVSRHLRKRCFDYSS